MKKVTVFLGIVFVLAASVGVKFLIDHGSLDGLGDDDHGHYLLADGSRDLTGDILVQEGDKINFGSSENWVSSPGLGEFVIGSDFETRFENNGDRSLRLFPELLSFFQPAETFPEASFNWAIDDRLLLSVGGGGQVDFTDGTFEPRFTNDIDLGTSTRLFKDAHLEGNLYLGDTDTGLHSTLGDLVYESDQLHEFKIAGNTQAAVSDDTFTFQQGANNVGFTWGTASELDVQIDGTPQVTFTDGTFEPVLTNDVHLGTTTRKFAEIHISGDLFAGAVHSEADDGGTIGSISTTNMSTAVGSGSTATLGKLAGISGGPTNAAQWGWVKIYDGTTVAWYPVWR